MGCGLFIPSMEDGDMMTLDQLWAKSQPKGRPLHPSGLLPQHLFDVVTAARMIVEATGDEQLCALGLEPETYRDRLRRCVLLAAAVHDLGKANDHFQGMIRGLRDCRDRPQGLRHEWVTVLILKALRSWLLPAVAGSEVDFSIVEWAVAGHHPGHDRDSPPKTCPPGAGPELHILAGHVEMSEIVNWMGKAFGLPGDQPLLVGSVIPLVGTGNVFADLCLWAKTARKLWDRMNTQDRRFVAAVKDGLIASDVAGSALPREEADEAKQLAVDHGCLRGPARGG